MKAFLGWFLLWLLRPTSVAFARWRLSTLDRKTQALTLKLMVNRRRTPYFDERRNRTIAMIFGMPMGTYTEPKLLDMLLGACVAQCNSAIAAGTTAQTTFNLRCSARSASADVTPVDNDVWLVVTAGPGATQNHDTNAHVFLTTARTIVS